MLALSKNETYWSALVALAAAVILVAVVAVAAEPETLPVIVLVTVKLIRVPTVVNDDVTTLAAIVVPVSADAATFVVSVPQVGTPPDTFKTCPLEPIPSLVNCDELEA